MLAVCSAHNGTIDLRQVDIPKVGPNDILVKVEAAAQNPTDWKFTSQGGFPKFIMGDSFNLSDLTIVGCDYAGVVTEVGESVTTDVKVGDRIVGWVFGSIEMNGAFAEYLVAPSHMFLKPPQSWSFEDGSQLAVACYTACQCLYQSLGLPPPENPTTTPIDILVWGGSSSVGHFVIQLAKLGGMRVIATASPKHFDRLKALGANEVFDYHDPEVPQKIRAYTNENLQYAIDCISEKSTYQLVSNSLSPEGGTISCILKYRTEVRPEVKVVFSIAYELFGKTFGSFTSSHEMIDLAKNSSDLISKLLAEGKITPAPLKIYPNGLASVSEGLEYMRSGKVSGEKIVYQDHYMNVQLRIQIMRLQSDRKEQLFVTRVM
ncbi:zinc-binding oxidoreductase ToxD [Dendrothele bispora CBS 962.96]|uniref:Zinc-binding oxidoreductase ToxD n=1 Tax=Dendrothele bispora (strain CBS 962.96) TaxID=1314807 RepID=A0A4S8MUG7_DENBC|nr:zinc-binding oxidoreductase ToxD [Dendrothele bispora CBS 962.96]